MWTIRWDGPTSGRKDPIKEVFCSTKKSLEITKELKDRGRELTKKRELEILFNIS